MKALINFLFSDGITITKTKANKGFMIYTPSQVPDIAKLKSLAESVNWKAIINEDEWDRGTKVRSASIYVGPVTSNLDIADKAAALAYLQDQEG